MYVMMTSSNIRRTGDIESLLRVYNHYTDNGSISITDVLDKQLGLLLNVRDDDGKLIVAS